MVDSSKTPRFLVHPLSACKQASRRQTVTWWGTTGHAASLVPLNCKLVKMSARKQAVALAHNAVPPDHRGFVLYLWTYEKKLYWYALDTGRTTSVQATVLFGSSVLFLARISNEAAVWNDANGQITNSLARAQWLRVLNFFFIFEILVSWDLSWFTSLFTLPFIK